MRAVCRRLILVLGAFCAAVFASPATAAGPPLPTSASGKAGAVAPGGSERLFTRRAGDDTLLVAVRRADRKLLRSRTIAGSWHIAPATLDGKTTGLSADGTTLVLPRPSRVFPQKTTELAVVDARTLTVRRRLVLPGFFTVDAISPGGRWAYLIQYAGEDILDYRVRALDTGTGTLAARDVVDPREPDEQMGGLPMTRVMSSDGRWAYTLYAGGHETFIHALDTVGRTAACIDLEMVRADGDLSLIDLSLSGDGGRLRVRDGGDTIAIVNTRTFAVREPGEPWPAEAQSKPEPSRAEGAVAPADDGDFPWPPALVAAGVAAIGIAAVTMARRRPA
jgi:hypothetical protein